MPVFGVGEQDGMPYYVMQFIQGLGLDEVLEELKKLQPGSAAGPARHRRPRGRAAPLGARTIIGRRRWPARC